MATEKKWERGVCGVTGIQRVPSSYSVLLTLASGGRIRHLGDHSWPPLLHRICIEGLDWGSSVRTTKGQRLSLRPPHLRCHFSPAVLHLAHRSRRTGGYLTSMVEDRGFEDPGSPQPGVPGHWNPAGNQCYPMVGKPAGAGSGMNPFSLAGIALALGYGPAGTPKRAKVPEPWVRSNA